MSERVAVARAPKVRAGAATRVLTGGVSVAATLAMVAGFAAADARSGAPGEGSGAADPGVGSALATGAAGAAGAALAPPRAVVRVVIVPQAPPTSFEVGEGAAASSAPVPPTVVAPAAPAAAPAAPAAVPAAPAAVPAAPAAVPAAPAAAPVAPAAAPAPHTSSGGS